MRRPARLCLSLLLSGVSLAGTLAVPQASAITIQANIPAASSGIEVRSVAAGEGHTCAILQGGHVKCWGMNLRGQLGYDDTVDRGDDPREMGDFLDTVDLGPGRTARAITAGYRHTCALLDNFMVKCWGDNEYGQLGLGDSLLRGTGFPPMGNSLPYVRLGTGRRARAIDAGYSHTCALLDNYSVKCWGRNVSGQLGIGSNVGDLVNIGDGKDEMGDNLRAVSLGARRRAKTISIGADHSCAILDNNTLKCWGSNRSGQLGLGDELNRGDDESVASVPVVNFGARRTVRSISAGNGTTCAILDNRALKCWGSNADGQLGLGDEQYRGDDESVAGLPAIDLGTGRTAKTVSVGSDHVCAILDNNSLKCWGYNGEGQTGIGSDVGANAAIGNAPGEMGDNLQAVNLGGRTPKSVATVYQSCVILDNNTLTCWGWNNRGQLGQGDMFNRGDDEPIETLAAINLGVRTRSINASGGFACALLEDRTVQCWGNNIVGVAGLGSRAGNLAQIGDQPGEMGNGLVAVPLGTGRTVRSLAIGSTSQHQCAILDDGSVKCWGDNRFGQLGHGDNTGDRIFVGDQPGEMGDALPSVFLGTGRTARSLVLGLSFTCALLDNYAVKCWGSNADGQLGIGNNTGNNASIGDQTGEMEALQAVNLGTRRTARAIAAGASHICTLLDNNAVKCWGRNIEGQIGRGYNSGAEQSIGDEAAEMGNGLRSVNLGTGRRARSIVAGGNHTCSILDNYTVKCWGFGNHDQLGTESSESRGGTGDPLGDDLPPVNLGSGRRARALSAGWQHTCALLDNYTVKCWGSNDEGQLGYGDTENLGGRSDTMGDFLPTVAVGGTRRVISVSAGFSSTCVLLDNSSIRCWGDNSRGQLGRGDMLNRGDESAEMGRKLKPTPMTG